MRSCARRVRRATLAGGMAMLGLGVPLQSGRAKPLLRVAAAPDTATTIKFDVGGVPDQGNCK